MGQIEHRKEKEKELHDHLGGDLAYDPRYSSNRKFYSICRSNLDYIRTWLAQRCRGKRVLDYCCGMGAFTIWLAKNGADAYGIDISPVSIGNASKLANHEGVGHKVKFQVMDAEATDFESDYFDLVVCSGVLHHLDLGKAYHELARILKPNGEVICEEALRHNVFIHWYRKMTLHLRSIWEVEHILGKKEIEMANNYFERVELLKFFHLATIGAVPFRNLSIFEPIRRGLDAVDSVLLRVPVLRWQAWIVLFVLSQPKN